MRVHCIHSFTILVLLATAACSTVQIRKPPEAIAKMSAKKAWSEVLKEFVDEKGRVNFAALAKTPDKLDRFATYLSRKSPQTHPEQFKTKEKQLAYALNAYNGLSMYNILDGGVTGALGGMQSTKFFSWRKFKIGGQIYSLDAYETEMRKMEEERIYFALNKMLAGSPRLSKEPFDADSLDLRLNALAKEFLSEERNVKVDTANKKVLLSEVLGNHKEDFLKKAPSLVAYVNKYRDEKIPEDFKVESLPFDWSINAQPAEPGKPADSPKP